MNEINYKKIISDLELRNEWTPLQANFEITLEQYIAILEYYSIHYDRRYGLIFDQLSNYLYAYRSGLILGKYKIIKQNNYYSITEMYMNLHKTDCFMIFDFIIEAFRVKNIEFDSRKMFGFLNKTTSLNEVIVRKQKPDLGPQSSSDNPFTAKARKLQSLWRVQNGLEIGIGSERNSIDKNGQPSYYGNMIKYGESTGSNFFYPETFAYAQWRVQTKLKDETINDYRLFNNLMSSMPMAFNLFHPLMMLHTQNPAAVDRMIQNAFPDFPIFKVKEIGLEFIPTPIERYTNDKSAMDAFIRFYDKKGGEYIIAIETKYTDSLGTNSASGKGVVKKQIQLLKELDLFTEKGIHKLESEEIQMSQLYRNFLLAEKYRQVQQLKNSYSIILEPKDHPSKEVEIDSFKELIKDEYKNLKLNKFSLESFVEKLKENCPFDYLDWLNWFEDRYLEFKKIGT